MTRATIIWATEYEAAWIMPPMVIKTFPMIMQFRRPSGMPITITRQDMKAAARVYEDAIMGMVSEPVGCCRSQHQAFNIS